jgi:aminoglycoside phosphotransferase (APT) family kinase protein
VERLRAGAGKLLPKAAELVELSGGFQNWNFLVRGGRDPLVLRLSASPEALRKEVALLKRLRATGSAVPVPTVLWSRPLGDSAMAAFTFMRGEMLWTARRRLDGGGRRVLSRQLGEILARIHGHEFPAFGLLNDKLEIESPVESYSEWTIAYLRGFLASPMFRKRVDKDLRKRLAECIDSHPDFHRPESGPRLCHGDFNEKNILADIDAHGNAAISAVLDWEFCLASTPSIDIGNLFRFTFIEPWIDPASFEDGYLGAGGKLAKNWRARACFIDLVALCDFLDSKFSRPKTEQTARRLLKASLNFLHRDA